MASPLTKNEKMAVKTLEELIETCETQISNVLTNRPVYEVELLREAELAAEYIRRVALDSGDEREDY